MLRVVDLAVARGGVPVLEGLGFALAAGRVMVLRGPNGAGKTTLLRTLAGLQPALSGRIEADPDILTYSGHADGLKATLTVAENLAFWAAVHGQSQIAAALDAMNLTGLQDRRAADLSAGQKRRLGLARLRVTGRSLWLMDEPTVSLDAASVGLFGAMLRGHLAQGGAAIVATHIDLGLPEAEVLDLGPFKAGQSRQGAFDEAFL
ncbi:heme ABC exporter ATP-binding protein CcmA [bacterium]|nr:heme ABC exporter ATP-binding protein CcmA [bacterium]